MKHPVWILNSALTILLCLVLGFMFLSRQKPPAREDIEPSNVGMPSKGETVKVNIHTIYENDLFGTYKKELPPTIADQTTLPTPPSPKPVTVPPVTTPQFMDPLNITLKGIIIMINDDTKNRAIIADNTTNKETIYKIGQTIQDAQLIRILSNKVIILRSNGQQEVLYLREKDAKIDPAYAVQSDWHDVIQKVSDTQYNVNPQEFVARVKNLAQFIDMLDLITVYKQGKSIGCKIGTMATNSFGSELGLQNHDLVVSINDIPATTTDERFKIYKDVTSAQSDALVTVKILRENQEMTLQFTLKDWKQKKTQNQGATSQAQPQAQPQTVVQMAPTGDELKDKQMRSLRQRHTFAPTLQEIRAKERENMLQNGKSSQVTVSGSPSIDGAKNRQGE